MNVLLVYAHPEPRSFNGAMRDLALNVLAAEGHNVEQSDLYAMRFDPVGGPHDFTDLQDNTFFKYQREQRHAAATHTFSPSLQQEIDKLRRADLLILQFPLWWYSLPAVMKGWIDRVFAMGCAYDAGRAREKGLLAGKLAMVAVTTGGPATSFGEHAFNSPIDDILAHIHFGMFDLAGMGVLPPFVAFGAARIDDAGRLNTLDAYARHLRAIPQLQPIRFRLPTPEPR